MPIVMKDLAFEYHVTVIYISKEFCAIMIRQMSKTLIVEGIFCPRYFEDFSNISRCKPSEGKHAISLILCIL